MVYHRTLTREKCLEIIEFRKAGHRDPEIASQFYVCIGTVFKSMEYYGLIEEYKQAKFFQTIVRLNKAVELRKEGFSIEIICKELGYKHYGTLYNALRKHQMIDMFKDAKFGTNYRFKSNCKMKPLSFPWVYNRRAIFGETFKEIGDAVNSSPKRIHRFCTKYNIPKATPEQAAKNIARGNASLW